MLRIIIISSLISGYISAMYNGGNTKSIALFNRILHMPLKAVGSGPCIATAIKKIDVCDWKNLKQCNKNAYKHIQKSVIWAFVSLPQDMQSIIVRLMVNDDIACHKIEYMPFLYVMQRYVQVREYFGKKKDFLHIFVNFKIIEKPKKLPAIVGSSLFTIVVTLCALLERMILRVNNRSSTHEDLFLGVPIMFCVMYFLFSIANKTEMCLCRDDQIIEVQEVLNCEDETIWL